MNHHPSHNLHVLPPVHDVLSHPSVEPLIAGCGREMVVAWVRGSLGHLRQEVLSGAVSGDRRELTSRVAEEVAARARDRDRTRFGRVINATGVVLHTSLGRAPLAPQALSALTDVATAANLEVDLDSGERRSRGYQLEAAWKLLTGAEASLVVNNNAAATLLALQALCAGREVLISRGQLIEIGGSFRLPDVFALSGAILREVGTTNRTRLSDYEAAISPAAAAILRVHPSNYQVVGFSETPEIEPLAELAHERGLIAIDDIGSGCLVDMTRYGLPAEPTFQRSLAAGADLVLGSGDKLLGGPQCGILLGRIDLLERIRRHPLARAVRIDKLTLGALAATLELYLAGKAEEVPVLSLLAASPEQLRTRAEAIASEARPLEELAVAVETGTTPVGGGSLPGAELPTAVLVLQPASLSAEELARRLRLGEVRVFGRIQQGRVLLDLRSVLPSEDGELVRALRSLASEVS